MKEIHVGNIALTKTRYRNVLYDHLDNDDLKKNFKTVILKKKSDTRFKGFVSTVYLGKNSDSLVVGWRGVVAQDKGTLCAFFSIEIARDSSKLSVNSF